MCFTGAGEGGTGTLTGGIPVADGRSPLGPGTPEGTVKLLHVLVVMNI